MIKDAEASRATYANALFRIEEEVRRLTRVGAGWVVFNADYRLVHSAQKNGGAPTLGAIGAARDELTAADAALAEAERVIASALAEARAVLADVKAQFPEDGHPWGATAPGEDA